MSVSQPFKASDFKCGKQYFFVASKARFQERNQRWAAEGCGQNMMVFPSTNVVHIQRHRIFREDGGFSILKLCESEGSGKFTKWD